MTMATEVMAPDVVAPEVVLPEVVLTSPVATRPRARSSLYLPAVAVALTTAGLLGIGAATLARDGNLTAGLAAGWAELVAPMVVTLIAVLLLCEWRWPAEPRSGFGRGRFHDAVFFALHVALVIPIMTLLGVGFGFLLGRGAGWIGTPWAAWWPRGLAVVVTLVLMDGANWAAHWADHRFTVLWRMHAVHHSQQEVTVLTSFRAHPLSHLAGFFLATVPVVLLLGDRGVAPVLITVYVCLGTLPHANVPWTLGPVGRIVVSPAYHRMHHSAEGTEGYNLGVVLTVWDVLTGRARFPAPDDPTFRTGLADRSALSEHANGSGSHLGILMAQLTEPFVRRRLPESESSPS